MIENKNISYLRIRPCDSDNEIYLNSRAKEGTSAFTLKPDLNINYQNLLINGFQTISSDIVSNSSAWFIDDELIDTKIKQKTPAKARVLIKFLRIRNSIHRVPTCEFLL